MSLAPSTPMFASASTSKTASLAPTADSDKHDGDAATAADFDCDDNVNVVNYSTGVDVAVDLVAGASTDDLENTTIDPASATAAAVRRKIDWQLLPLLFFLYTVQGIDKGSLGSSAILGIRTDTHLNTDEYNNTGSAFFIGYLIFQYPQQLALQRFPVGRWLAFNIFLWALFVGLQATCTSYGGIFTVRFLLGATEGSVTAGVMLVCGMFYTRTEIGERIGWTFNLNGFALIVSSFLSFAVYHANPKGSPNRWQWLMVIECLLTVIVFSLFWWRFPDNPTTAKFLTKEERVIAVKRVHGNQNGIETKIWKKYQLVEALRDPKTWLFFLFAVVSNLQNGIGVQYSLIISSFGFSTWQTTLLSIPSGAAQIINVTIGCYLLRKFQNSRSWIAMGAFVPSLIAALLLITLPWGNKNGLLISYYLLNLGGTAGFVMVLSWVTSTSAGHTKKLATNGIFLMGYALGQVLCTQFWKAEYRPRNYVPWGICIGSYIGDWIILFTIRTYLKRENARRDRIQFSLNNVGLEGGSDEKPGEITGVEKPSQPRQQQRFGIVQQVGEDGAIRRRKVDKSLLDLTDRENLDFRYVL